jgi:hypothetical protein
MSVHHHTTQIIQPTRFNSFTSSLLDVYVWLNMLRTSPRPSSRVYNCTRSLWLWSGRLQPARPQPTTLQPLLSNGKTRGSYCSCMLLMMGGETPETCWATHKRQVINLWNCCISLVELFELNETKSWYWNFCRWFINKQKKSILRTKKVKLWNNWCFVESKTEIMQFS